MKNLMKLLIGFFLISTLLISCDKDDDNQTEIMDDVNIETENYLKIGDDECVLSGGVLANGGIDDGDNEYIGYETFICFYSEGLSLQIEEEKFLGKGNTISFNMFSTTGTNLDNGDYHFTSTEPYPIGTIGYGDYTINTNISVCTDDDHKDIASGTVSVSKNSDEYTITINGTSKNGKTITGFYKGTLLYIGDDDDEIETKNYLKIGDDECVLSGGVLLNGGIDDGNNEYIGYETSIAFYSEGLSLQIEEEELLGKGNTILFNMFSTTGTNLDNGDYNFTSTEPYPIGTIRYGDYTINTDFAVCTDDDYKDIASGTVSVSKNGDEYTITINGTSKNGKTITGYYKGTLLYIDEQDDDEIETKNYLIVDDVEYDLSTGFIQNRGIDDDNSSYYGYYDDLLLYSEGLSMQIAETGYNEFVGKGHAISLDLFSITGNLDNGDYYFTSTFPYPTGTIGKYSGYVINFDTENKDAEERDSVTSGKVSVSKNGDEYIITIDCISKDGKNVVGFYKGTLDYFGKTFIKNYPR